MKLSVLIPVYNEERTVAEVVQRVAQLPLDLEMVLVDDGSRDGTWDVLQGLTSPTIRAFRHEHNRGKGAALRTAIPHARGDYVVVQDGDLEYDPADLVHMLALAEEKDAPVVYGNRVHGRFRKSYFRFYWGGRLLTAITNLLFRTGIHDEPVCYKMFRRELLQSLPLQCSGFEFCPEVTALVALSGYRITEVDIYYNPRSFAEGKKINWRDGVIAVWTLIRWRLRGWPPGHPRPGD
jgi:glycosyltransferase involved in cell wall biosynthesis